MKSKTWIIIFIVAIGAYWIGYSQNKQIDKAKSIPVDKATSVALQKLSDEVNTPRYYPDMTQDCSSVFTTIKNNNALAETMPFSDFGNLLTSYLKYCSPNINATRGVYGGGGVTINLGSVPLQGYSVPQGSTEYSLFCGYRNSNSVYNPNSQSFTQTNGDYVDCSTSTKTSVSDEMSRFGKLSCSVNTNSFTSCDFTPDDVTRGWPAFGKPQKFTSTIDKKHGFNCTPNIPSDTQNYNWDCKPY